MTPIFSFKVDCRRSLVTIVLSGFFEAADVSAFTGEKDKAYGALECGPNQHATLVDVTECKIQSQAVFDAFAALISDPRHRARRLAFVVGGSLAKMQVRRLLKCRSDAQCFDDKVAAEAWLTETGMPQVATG